MPHSVHEVYQATKPGVHTRKTDARALLGPVTSPPDTTIMLDRWVNESSRKELSVTEVLQQPIAEYPRRQ